MMMAARTPAPERKPVIAYIRVSAANGHPCSVSRLQSCSFHRHAGVVVGGGLLELA
jgi:hypothetical protein